MRYNNFPLTQYVHTEEKTTIFFLYKYLTTCHASRKPLCPGTRDNTGLGLRLSLLISGEHTGALQCGYLNILHCAYISLVIWALKNSGCNRSALALQLPLRKQNTLQRVVTHFKYTHEARSTLYGHFTLKFEVLVRDRLYIESNGCRERSGSFTKSWPFCDLLGMVVTTSPTCSL